MRFNKARSNHLRIQVLTTTSTTLPHWREVKNISNHTAQESIVYAFRRHTSNSEIRDISRLAVHIAHPNNVRAQRKSYLRSLQFFFYFRNNFDGFWVRRDAKCRKAAPPETAGPSAFGPVASSKREDWTCNYRSIHKNLRNNLDKNPFLECVRT